MDIDELTKLNNTSYFTFILFVLDNFNKINRKDYKKYITDDNFDILIKSESNKEVSVNFKHDSINFCSASMDFSSSGKLLNIRAQIVPVGIFNKRRAKNYFNKILSLFRKIAQYSNTEIEEKIKNEHYQLVADGLIMTVVRSKNIASGQPYVSTWCEVV